MLERSNINVCVMNDFCGPLTFLCGRDHYLIVGRCDCIWNHSIFSLFYAQPTFRCTHSTRLRTHAMRSPFYAQSRSGPATQSCFRFALARIVRMMIRTATTTAICRTKYQPTITISYNSRHHEQLQEDGRKGAPVAEHCGRLGATLSAGRGMVAPNTTGGAGAGAPRRRGSWPRCSEGHRPRRRRGAGGAAAASRSPGPAYRTTQTPSSGRRRLRPASLAFW